MTNFPRDILTLVFTYLPKSSLVSTSMTCHFWKQISDDILWRKILCELLKIDLSDLQKIKLDHHPKILVKNLCHLKKMITLKETYRNISSFLKKNTHTPLLLACLDDNIDLFTFKLLEKINLNAWLDFACAYGAHNVVSKLLIHPQVRTPDHSLLKFAAGSGNKSLVICLLENNSTLEVDKTVLEYAHHAENQELLSYLNQENTLRHQKKIFLK